MNIDSILKKEKIEVQTELDNSQVAKIANVISEQICNAFPEHNLSTQDVFSILTNINMYISKIPDDSAIAKYFPQNNSIYFSEKMNFEHIDTLVIHECIHAIQELKNERKKLLRLGLYDLTTNKGEGINEAAVQLMASIATNVEKDNVKYYNMNFTTPSPIFYPIETALIEQMIYFTGNYPLFHSTLHSNQVFKNTFIAKSNEKVFNKIESNFDLIIHYEELLSIYLSDISNSSSKKAQKLNKKIETIKLNILQTTLSTQNLIIEYGFNSEFDLIRDKTSLIEFNQKLCDFNEFLIKTDSYTFYNEFYNNMLIKLDEKAELIEQYGSLNYLDNLQNELLDFEKDNSRARFFRKILNRIKSLFENSSIEKNDV